MSKIQTFARHSLRVEVVAAVAVSLAAFAPAGGASQPYRGASLGVNGSANAVEHRLLEHLAEVRDPGRSANAQEHRLAR